MNTKRKNTIYQCPYSRFVKCDMLYGCGGCEEFKPKDGAVAYETAKQVYLDYVTWNRDNDLSITFYQWCCKQLTEPNGIIPQKPIKIVRM